MVTTGYVHPDYAKALAEYGTPRELPRCGGWLLERPIPGSAYKDAMGCYPLFACCDWSQLNADLDDLACDLVSVSLVTDPFGDYTPEMLGECFPDRMLAFKEHYVLDMRQAPEKGISSRAKRTVRAALKKLHAEVCADPGEFFDDWVRLYECLIERHNLTGVHAFSRDSLALQMCVPGFVMFRASWQQQTVGMSCWYVQNDVANGHLMAINPQGYELGAAYALHWSTVHHFVGKVHWLNFMGVPGTRDSTQTGLAWFKRQWSSGTKPAYLCGRILNRARYEEVASARQTSDEAYFPAYRAGEFR